MNQRWMKIVVYLALAAMLISTIFMSLGSLLE